MYAVTLMTMKKEEELVMIVLLSPPCISSWLCVINCLLAIVLRYLQSQSKPSFNISPPILMYELYFLHIRVGYFWSEVQQKHNWHKVKLSRFDS